MRRLFQAGTLIIILGTLIDLAYHAVTEPEEILPLEHPVEVADHALIFLGLGTLVVAGIIAALKD